MDILDREAEYDADTGQDRTAWTSVKLPEGLYSMGMGKGDQAEWYIPTLKPEIVAWMAEQKIQAPDGGYGAEDERLSAYDISYAYMGGGITARSVRIQFEHDADAQHFKLRWC